MRALLEATRARRSRDPMRGWSIHSAERALESSDQFDPAMLVLNRERVGHQ